MVTLKLEQIGNARPWVARIIGTDPKYGVAREFATGVRDYSQANKPRTRGVYTTYTLDEGIWEINAPRSWGNVRRYWARCSGGKVEEITGADALKAAEELQARREVAHA